MAKGRVLKVALSRSALKRSRDFYTPGATHYQLRARNPATGRVRVPRVAKGAKAGRTNRPAAARGIRAVTARPLTIVRHVAAGAVSAAGRTLRNRTKYTIPRYIESPVWGGHTAYGGGSSVQAILGPAAARDVNRGQTTLPNTPTVMGRLRELYPASSIIAGHLLNANWGGTGGAHNITPLTSAANSAHKTIENRITNALGVMDRHLERNPSPMHYGISYEVTVSTERAAMFPQTQYLAKFIRVRAQAVERDPLTGVIGPSPEAQRIMQFHPVDQRIYN